MRLWTLHPKYLDSRGLVAVWREGLLAQAVLLGKTKGYRHHPQLGRFKEGPSPVGAIADYLRAVHAESVVRGYAFAADKISRSKSRGRITTTAGQLAFEWDHLHAKLRLRDPRWRKGLSEVERPQPHPLFRVVAGGTEPWEKL